MEIIKTNMRRFLFSVLLILSLFNLTSCKIVSEALHKGDRAGDFYDFLYIIYESLSMENLVLSTLLVVVTSIFCSVHLVNFYKFLKRFKTARESDSSENPESNTITEDETAGMNKRHYGGVNLPFEINSYTDNILEILLTVIITLLLMINISYAMILVPLFFVLFTRFRFYKIIFQEDSVIFKYIYFLKLEVTKEQIVRLYIHQNSVIEFHWKKSSKHSTKIIKIPVESFLKRDIPVESIRYFFKTVYNR